MVAKGIAFVTLAFSIPSTLVVDTLVASILPVVVDTFATASLVVGRLVVALAFVVAWAFVTALAFIARLIVVAKLVAARLVLI
jgi:hypothetical protein